jgi:3-oxoacyl-[acyl-carrier protein] reductase
MDAEQVLIAIGEQGGRAVAVEADLTQPGTSARLFDLAESSFGPVDILINNATGWVADTFFGDACWPVQASTGQGVG